MPLVVELENGWVGYTEGRRRAALLRSLGVLLVALGAALRASRSGAASDVVTFVVVAVSCFAGVAVVIDFFVRPRHTERGTAFLVLTPAGSVSCASLVVTNPNATLPGRLVVAAEAISWTSARAGHLLWRRDDVADVAIRRVASFRPLGYLTLRMTDGSSFTARVFQPRALAVALRTCGYPGAR